MEASELRQRGQLPGQGLGTGGPGAEQELRQAGAPFPRDGGAGGTGGLVQGSRPAQGMDRMQEGIQMLMQLAAQQTGRQ